MNSNSPDLFQNLFDILPVACLILNENQVITKVNLEALTLLEEPKLNIEGRLFTSFVRNDNIEIWNSSIENVSFSNPSVSVELLLCRCNYQFFSSKVAVSATIDANNKVTYTLFVHSLSVQPILHNNQHLYQTVVNHTNDVIGIINSSAVILFINDAASEIFGVSAAECIGQSAYNFIQPDELAITKASLEHWISSNRETFSWETKHQLKQGNPRHITWAISRNPSNNNEFIAIGRDISDRKLIEYALIENEIRLNLALKATKEAIWDWNLETESFYYSPGWWAMLGLKEQEFESNASLWQNLLHPNCQKEAISTVNNAIENADSFSIHTLLQHKNGFYIPVLTQGYILRNNNNKAIRVSGTNSDLTEQIASEQKRLIEEEEKNNLVIQNRQLQKTESLGKMAAAIAHHFNNKLMPIMLNLDMAVRLIPKGINVTDILEETKQAALKAAEVSTLMLTYLGKSETKKSDTNLTAVCQTHINLLQAGINKKLQLLSDFGTQKLLVSADENQIKQLLSNLVTNACEASEETFKPVFISLFPATIYDISKVNRFPFEYQPMNYSYACLKVKDNGCGVPSADIEKLFDPFWTTKFEGRGLGLAVVLGIVKEHKAIITVESELNTGTTVKVFIPLIKSTDNTLPSNLFKSKKTTILVIDDEPDILKGLTSLICSIDFSVITASDGIKGIDLFQKHRNDVCLVICDATMPKMDGQQTIKKIREISPGTPVILCSGYNYGKIFESQFTEKPNAFLMKPFVFDVFSETIFRVINDSAHRCS